MNQKINAEYRFSKQIDEDFVITLTLYIDYEKKSYDIVQGNQEGIFPRINGTETDTNRAYFNLALEALDFIQHVLFKEK